MATTEFEVMGRTGAAPQSRALTPAGANLCQKAIGTMAHISEFSIVTYERKPKHWRAAISPKILFSSSAPGVTVHHFVTPYDDSASEAQFAVEQL
jgi:hypothetical protein